MPVTLTLQCKHFLPNIDRAVKLTMDFTCPGFPSHLLKINNERMLLMMKPHIGKTPICIFSDIEMTPEWEEEVKTRRQPESIISCYQTSTLDMLAFTIASEAEQPGELARYALQRCVDSPQVAAVLYKKGEHVIHKPHMHSQESAWERLHSPR